MFYEEQLNLATTENRCFHRKTNVFNMHRAHSRIVSNLILVKRRTKIKIIECFDSLWLPSRCLYVFFFFFFLLFFSLRFQNLSLFFHSAISGSANVSVLLLYFFFLLFNSILPVPMDCELNAFFAVIFAQTEYKVTERRQSTDK